jgi:patatin-like phospholipase/acyl hydrolase
MSSKQRPLRLLALDGGGVRGLSSLIILKRIMYILGRRQGLPGQQLLRPCDHFDMIAGTSTGGLIAIMLGTFSMGVQECIDAYLDMAPKIFPKEDFVSGSALGKAWKGVRGTARFDAAALEAEVKKLIVEHLKEEPNVVFDQIPKSEDDCHV